MSEQKSIDIEISDPTPKKKPFGLLVFGTLNLVVFGVITLVTLAYVYSKGNSLITPIIEKALKEQNLNINFDNPAIKQGLIIQMIMAGMYIVSGVGLLMASHWGRRFSLYLALFLCILVVVSVGFSPKVVSQAFIQIVYPAGMILYLTNKNVNDFFRKN